MWVFIGILIIAFLYFGFLKNKGSENIPDTPITIEPYDHFYDYNNVNQILTMPIKPGNPAVNNVQESLATGTSKFCHPCDPYNPENKRCLPKYPNKPCPECPQPFLGYDQPCGPCGTQKPEIVSQKLLDRIIVRQPFFLDGPDIREYYGQKYYNDFRYPEYEIPIEFAKDPNGYCNKFPYRYPCYVRYSRHDLK